MDILFYILKTLSTFLTLYSLVCLVRVFLTWVPNLAYSPFGRFLAHISDPYLNLFRKLNPTAKFGIDISPIFAFALLMLLTNVLDTIAYTRTFSVGIIIAQIISLAWSVVSSIITIINIVVLVRLIAMLLKKNSGQIWVAIDQMLFPLTTKINSIFAKNKYMKPTTLLLILLIIGLAIKFGMEFLIAIIVSILL